MSHLAVPRPAPYNSRSGANTLESARPELALPGSAMGLDQALGVQASPTSWVSDVLAAPEPNNRRPEFYGGAFSPELKQVITAFVDARLELGPISIAAVAALTDLRSRAFNRNFQGSFGVTCQAFIGQRRIDKALRLLAEPKSRLVDVAFSCGFTDQPAFTRAFKRATGICPGAWRRCLGSKGRNHQDPQRPSLGLLSFSRIF